MKEANVYRIEDTYIDLSQIKSFRLTKIDASKKDNRLMEIFLKDRMYFVNGNRNDIEFIHDVIELVFESQAAAEEAAEELGAAWDNFIANNKHN